MSPEARSVLAVLQATPDWPILGRRLAEIIGLSSEKRVSDAVAELRVEHGYLVVAGQDGYRMAQTDAERRAYVATIDARIAGLSRTRRAIVQREPELAQLPLDV